MSHLSAHVLDAAAGVPASGIAVQLATADGELIATGTTDRDGRVSDLGPDQLAPGHYQVTFATGDYFAARDTESFHPSVTVLFVVTAGEPHYHVPLLLSPYAYTTYRGS